MITKRLLVVEDHKRVLELMCEALESAGYQTVRATNVREAINLGATQGPHWDLMVIDRRLPDGDGMELGWHWPTLPRLFVSGHMDADLIKPFTSAQLIAAVGRKLGESDDETGRRQARAGRRRTDNPPIQDTP